MNKNHVELLGYYGDDSTIAQSAWTSTSRDLSDEKIERMTTILPNILPQYDNDVKLEALSFLNQNKETANLNMRTLIMVIKMRYSNPDNWMDMATYMLNS